MSRAETMAVKLDTALRLSVYLMALFLPFSITGSQTALGVMILLVAGRAVLRRRLGFAIGVFGWLIVALIAWAVLAAPLAEVTDHAPERLAKYWIWLTYFVVLAGLDSRETAMRSLAILVGAAGVVAVYGIAQHFFGEAVLVGFLPPKELPTTTTGAVHAVGLFDHHLTYGNSLALTILLGIGLFGAVRKMRDRIWLAAALATSFAALLWSFARSAWVGILAGLIALGALLGRRALTAIMIGALVVGVAAYSLSPGLADRMERVIRIDKNLERVFTWKTTVDMIQDFPLFGIGPGAYRQMTEQYRDGYNIHWTATSHAHNSYLHFAAESGVVAGLLLALLIGAAIGIGALRQGDVKRDEAGRRLIAGGVGACVCFAVASLLQHNAGDAEVCMLYQFAAALVVFLSRDSRDEEVTS